MTCHTGPAAGFDKGRYVAARSARKEEGRVIQPMFSLVFFQLFYFRYFPTFLSRGDFNLDFNM